MSRPDVVIHHGQHVRQYWKDRVIILIYIKYEDRQTDTQIDTQTDTETDKAHTAGAFLLQYLSANGQDGQDGQMMHERMRDQWDRKTREQEEYVEWLKVEL